MVSTMSTMPTMYMSCMSIVAFFDSLELRNILKLIVVFDRKMVFVTFLKRRASTLTLMLCYQRAQGLQKLLSLI